MRRFKSLSILFFVALTLVLGACAEDSTIEEVEMQMVSQDPDEDDGERGGMGGSANEDDGERGGM